MAFSIDREDTYHILFWLHRLNTQFGHGLFKRESLSHDDCHDDDDDGDNDGDDYVFLVIMVQIMMQPPFRMLTKTQEEDLTSTLSKRSPRPPLRSFPAISDLRNKRSWCCSHLYYHWLTIVYYYYCKTTVHNLSDARLSPRRWILRRFSICRSL